MQANRVHFINRCLERLAPIEEHVHQFAQAPWDIDNLKQLSDHFHQVAGSAGLYKVAELTPIAQTGERLCRYMLENPPDDVIIYARNFRELVMKMRSVLEQARAEYADNSIASDPGHNQQLNQFADKEKPPAAQQTSPLSSSDSAIKDGPPLSPQSSTGKFLVPDFDFDMPAASPAPSEEERNRTTGTTRENQEPMPATRADIAPQSAALQYSSPGEHASQYPATFTPESNSPAPSNSHLFTASEPRTIETVSGPDVIVVSSDPASLNGLSGILARESMRVRQARSYSEAKMQIEAKFPDGLVIFIPLRDGNGYELARICRSLPAGESISIILVSEEQGFLDKISAIKCGVDSFFELPVEVDVVVEKLRFLFERGKPERYRILSVEDDPDQASYIVSILQSAGYHILWQQDPRLFEEALLTFCPDLLLLDIVMGDITGYELARFVRQNERFAAIPILFLTTHNQIEAHIESARAGGDDHLIKPVNPELLVATVAGKLERYRIFKRLLRNDGLTQILNHSHFMEYAQRSVAIRSQRFSQVLTVFNIDNLRAINDRYGFAIGDRTIVSLVQLIKKIYRHTDIVGRISGDEIAVLDDSLPINDSIKVTKSLLDKFAALPHKAGGEVFRLTASAGVAHLEGQGTIQELMDRATRALADAKMIGKNQIIVG